MILQWLFMAIQAAKWVFTGCHLLQIVSLVGRFGLSLFAKRILTVFNSVGFIGRSFDWWISRWGRSPGALMMAWFAFGWGYALLTGPAPTVGPLVFLGDLLPLWVYGWLAVGVWVLFGIAGLTGCRSPERVAQTWARWLPVVTPFAAYLCAALFWGFIAALFWFSGGSVTGKWVYSITAWASFCCAVTASPGGRGGFKE